MRRPSRSMGVGVAILGALTAPWLSATSVSAQVPNGVGMATSSDRDPSENAILEEPAADIALQLARLATLAEETYPTEFSYASLAEGGSSGYIAFRDAVPAQIQLESQAIETITFVPNLGYTSTELQEYAAALSQSVNSDELDNATAVTASPRPMDGEFVVKVGPVQLEGEGVAIGADLMADANRVQEDINAFVQSTPPPASFAVQVEADLENLTEPEAEDGGRTLAGTCTGAFPVKRDAGSELGVLTAGHCPGVGSYGSTSNMFYPVFPSSISTSYSSATGGDFRWNHSRYMLSGSTSLGTGGQRKFASASNSVYGGTVCGYGKTTGHKCGSVWSVGSTATIYVPAGNAHYTVGPLACTVNHVTDGGDSGGPWYLKGSSVATGIHSGHYNGASCWSSVRNAMRAFGVSLWTG